MTPGEIYQRAIDTYGPTLQLEKAKEECLEFLVSMMHHEQERVPVETVIEELADVIITSQQARIILGSDAVDLAIGRKLDRLVYRMESGG